jgi:SNF2 family DNA or RNA helicase
MAYLMLRGRFSNERQEAADVFQGEDPLKEYNIFFTTTGKGGVGINLTAASTFVLIDPC